MPLPLPNRNPPFNIIRVSHVSWGVTDLARSRTFYVDILGYLCEDETEDALYLRGLEERNHHSLILRKSETPQVDYIGFKVGSEEDLDLAEQYFTEAGAAPRWIDSYAQGRTLQVRDPFGIPLEFYYEMERRELMLQKYTHYKGARIQRIDHVNVFANDVNAFTRYYVSELGFRITEVTMTDIEDDHSDIWAAWTHRKGNVHDMAFTNGLGPRLHHIGVWVPTATDIINFCDLLASAGYRGAFERGPGRHGISNAFFFYMRDPDGHRIELFSSDYMTMDPDHPPRLWNLDDPSRQTLWGQAAPRTWFEEGSLFSDTEIYPPSLNAKPIIAPE
ncbi:MAG: 3,4-dihydroxyphenylacetate 2,3-dioxygenase [Candidatus Latescibacteria bacterium]|jgi:catechol 2,3-dioxygenase|nr:3,4-dihydroxyphenylacetate 2,3-dioxygenase [Candidatus Latescibacterota bacterium]